MGNYPYPSPYILNGAGVLPAFPVRVACSHLGKEGLDSEEALLGGLAGERMRKLPYAWSVSRENEPMLICWVDFAAAAQVQ